MIFEPLSAEERAVCCGIRLQSRAESESFLGAVHPTRGGATAQRSALIARSRAPRASRRKACSRFFFLALALEGDPISAVDVRSVCGPFLVSRGGAVFESVEAANADRFSVELRCPLAWPRSDRTAAEATLQRLAYRSRGCGLDRQAPVVLGDLYMSTAAMEVGEHRGPRVSALEPRRSLEAIEKGESLRRTAPLGHSQRAIERVDRGGRKPLQERVALDDSVPASGRERRREAVLRGDSRFRVEPGEDVPVRRSGQL